MKLIEQRDAAWERFTVTTAAVALAAGAALGGLVGWNVHETSDVYANYVAGLPTCEGGR